jgi:pilus assembly protein Flp/PilA
MENVIGFLSAKFRFPILQEEGQDLVEYALLVALISLGSVVAMSTLAVDISSVFNTAGTALTSAVA